MNIDESGTLAWFPAMNLNRLRTMLARLNLTKAASEASVLKDQFCREDEEPYRQGREADVWADRGKLLGGSATDRAEVLTVNGVRISL